MTNSIEKTKQRKKQRLEICKNCEFFNKITTQCNQCGCIMSIKSLLPDAKCPKGKW